MLQKEENGIQWLEFELLAACKRIDHRVFLRHGGVSTGTFESLNFSHGKGDSIENIQANVALIKKLTASEALATLHQTHGKDVHFVDESAKLSGDALTTNRVGLSLLVKHADCQAACFYDPIQHAMSMVHCGWRGNVQNIYAETIKKMRFHYGSQVENLLVCISPSLGPERSEFIHYKLEFPEPFWQFQFKPDYFDLWALSDWQLRGEGILPGHIQIARECTWKNPEKYFSYRRSPQTGCHGSIGILIN